MREKYKCGDCGKQFYKNQNVGLTKMKDNFKTYEQEIICIFCYNKGFNFSNLRELKRES